MTSKPQNLKNPEKWIGKRVTHFANAEAYRWNENGYFISAWSGKLYRSDDECSPQGEDREILTAAGMWDADTECYYYSHQCIMEMVREARQHLAAQSEESEPSAQQTATEVQQIPVASIRAGDNDRKDFNQSALQELANSIREHGLAQPITVRPMDGGTWFQIVAGERRFRAVSLLQWTNIPALVRELSDEQASAIMLVENTSRVDLDPVTEAAAYQQRVERFGWDAEKIAKTAGVSVERVKNRLRLLTLAEDVQHFVKVGQFPIGHAQIMGDLDNNRQRIALRIFNSAKSMPLLRFREVVDKLYTEQVAEQQTDMFALELQLVEEYKDNCSSLRGKGARTGAPVREDLPPVEVSGKDSVGDILDRYIWKLLQAGDEQAAATLGTVYNALVAGNWLQVPAGSLLAKTNDTVAGTAPVVKR